LVTIGMPVHNVEPYVEASLLSVLNQTFDNLEVIVVDDRGKDKSMDVVRRVVATHPRGGIVRIIDHGVNRGTGATKNTIIDNARGEYLYLLDSDDILTADCIQQFYDRMEGADVDLVFASHSRNYDDRTVRIMSGDATFKGEQALLSHFREHIRERFPVGTVNKLYNTEFLRRCGIRCIPHHTIEDVWFTFQVCMKAASFSCINVITYNQVVHTDSQSHITFSDKSKTQYDEIIRAERDMLKHYDRIPKGGMNLYCSYLEQLIPFIRSFKTYTDKEIKQTVLDYCDLRGMHFRYCDIYGWRTRLLVVVFKIHNYYIVRNFLTLLRKYIQKKYI